MTDILKQLDAILEQRKSENPDKSYVAGLYAKGTDAILKKVGEEATETILAAKNGVTANIIHETADLWFHTLVMLKQHNLDYNDVLLELQQRFGTSGLVEKAARDQHD